MDAERGTRLRISLWHNPFNARRSIFILGHWYNRIHHIIFKACGRKQDQNTCFGDLTSLSSLFLSVIWELFEWINSTVEEKDTAGHVLPSGNRPRMWWSVERKDLFFWRAREEHGELGQIHVRISCKQMGRGSEGKTAWKMPKKNKWITDQPTYQRSNEPK